MSVKEQPLNDAELRHALISWLQKKSIQPKKIMEELNVNNGLAIADVVALYSEAHCFEIKGDNDSIERALHQGKSYNLAFRKISLLTTKKHLKKALTILPDYWGILLAWQDNDKTRIKYIRKSSLNSEFDKKIAASILWKHEMLQIINENEIKVLYKNKNRDFLAMELSTKLNTDTLNKQIVRMLSSRI